MRTVETGERTSRRRAYATNSTLAGINLVARKRPARRTRQR